MIACSTLLGFAAGASSQEPRWLIKPESLPNWRYVEVLSERLIASEPNIRDRAEAELLALGKPALHPLLIIGIRNLPQSAEVQRVWPKFGDDFINETVDLEISEGSLAPCKAVARMGKSVVPNLLALLGRNHYVSRRFALCVLRNMGGDGVPTLRDIVRNPRFDVSTRAGAIDELMESRDERAAELFLEGLADTNPGIVWRSALGLARLKDQRVIPKLIEMTGARGEMGEYREVALSGLGAMYTKSLRGVIARAAWRDDDLLVRKAASNALMGHGDRAADRIGGRYFPIYRNSLFPYYEWGPRLGGGAFFVCLAVWLAARRKWLGGLGLGVIVGIYWGFFVRDVWIQTETWLLAVFVPVALLGLLMFGCSERAIGVVLAWTLVNAFAPLTLMLVPILGPMAFAIPAWGPFVFPVIALLGLRHYRERDPGALARDRSATRAVAAAFYLSYAVSFAALWGYLGF